MESINSILKPCPFCGGKAVLFVENLCVCHAELKLYQGEIKFIIKECHKK